MSCRDVGSWMSSIWLHDDMVSWINRFGICMLDRWLPVEWPLPDLGNRICMHTVCHALWSWYFCHSNICNQTMQKKMRKMNGKLLFQEYKCFIFEGRFCHFNCTYIIIIITKNWHEYKIKMFALTHWTAFQHLCCDMNEGILNKKKITRKNILLWLVMTNKTKICICVGWKILWNMFFFCVACCYIYSYIYKFNWTMHNTHLVIGNHILRHAHPLHCIVAASWIVMVIVRLDVRDTHECMADCWMTATNVYREQSLKSEL